MKFINYSSIQNIVCLDVKNAVNNDIYTYFMMNKLSESTKSYIEYLLKQNIVEFCESERIECIYLHNDLVLAITYENYEMNMKFENLFIGELKKLPIISDSKAQKFINLFMENLMTNHKWDMKESYFMNLLQFQNRNEESEVLFLNQTAAFNVSSYNLKLIEILSPKKFKPAYCELKRLYPEMKIVNNLIVQKMYFYKQLPIAFSAKLLGTNIEQWFWSDQFEESLLLIEPIPLVVPECELTVNAILDKINYYGLPYLTANEINFLENYK